MLTIDYIIYDQRFPGNVKLISRLDSIITDVSDHIPVKCEIIFQVDLIKEQMSNTSQKTKRVNW